MSIHRETAILERQSAKMSKITNDGLTVSSGKGCFTAVPIWQQWASKGKGAWHIENSKNSKKTVKTIRETIWLLSSERILLSVDPNPSNPANVTPPTRVSPFYAAARCKNRRWQFRTSWKSKFYRTAVAPNASSPRVLSRMSWFLTQCSTTVCA